MIFGVFISGPHTGAGKTFVARGLARASGRAGRSVAAIKPFETGVHALPEDASALARASGRPDLATVPDFYRVPLPLAPYAAAIEQNSQPPDLALLTRRIQAVGQTAEVLIVEGAGGLLVPLTATATIADFAASLGLPLVLVATDQLGVLSSVLTCVESATLRQIPVAAIVLTNHGPAIDDPSPRTNQQILQERLPCPVFSFPPCNDDDDALADAAERTGLVRLLQAIPLAPPFP
jgi:dethiobiotin synthetase